MREALALGLGHSQLGSGGKAAAPSLESVIRGPVQKVTSQVVTLTQMAPQVASQGGQVTGKTGSRCSRHEGVRGKGDAVVWHLLWLRVLIFGGHTWGLCKSVKVILRGKVRGVPVTYFHHTFSHRRGIMHPIYRLLV